MRPTREKCREMIYSNEYLDLIFGHQQIISDILAADEESCEQRVNDLYRVVHVSRRFLFDYDIQTLGYQAIPSLFTLQDMSALEASGITTVLGSRIPGRDGAGVLIGVIDTGIDYTHPAFRDAAGRTRIVSIWDQTAQPEFASDFGLAVAPELASGPLPVPGAQPAFGLLYGAEYGREQIDEALRTADPYRIVPVRDEDGHGTFVAGLAAGSGSADGRFLGAAPGAELVIVKLKEAKPSLKEYFLVPEQARVYQETDLMMGLHYLSLVQARERRPLVICLALGTNTGGHDGYRPLEQSLTLAAQLAATVPVVPAGNNHTGDRHAYVEFSEGEAYRDVELLTAAEGREEGAGSSFRLELWADLPGLYRISLLSPEGESYPEIPLRPGQSARAAFLLGGGVVDIDYVINASGSGSQLIAMAFRQVSAGIWTIRIIPQAATGGSCHLWLPAKGQGAEQARFLAPDPQVTVTVPATARDVVTAGGYNMASGGITAYSGRGFGRLGEITPTIAAPAESVFGPVPGGVYEARSGTSAACAITAGAVADLLAWQGRQERDAYISAGAVRAYLARGAKMPEAFPSPNAGWGYGRLDLWQAIRFLAE